MSHHLLDLLALTLVPGLGDKNVKQLISYCGSPAEVFSSPRKKLEGIPGFGEKSIKTIKENRTHSEAERILKEAEKKEMLVLSYLDKGYPERLKYVMDSPPIIYVKGAGELNPSRTLAIVGTRRATDYGKQMTQKIVEAADALGAQVISGLAYGIDIEAHRAALRSGSSTIAILAGGLDHIYPSAHRKNAEEMQSNGAIISECIPDTKPEAHLFPARNRIIAGMADAVIVVEAAEKGGALITAKIADSYNRTLFAVPGNVDHTYSAGTNQLIASQMALIYTGIEDLKYHLNWDETLNKEDIQQPLPEMTDQERAIFNIIRANGQSLEIDHIAIKSQTPINQVASILLGLEFKNVIKSFPGKKYGMV